MQAACCNDNVYLIVPTPVITNNADTSSAIIIGGVLGSVMFIILMTLLMLIFLIRYSFLISMMFQFLFYRKKRSYLKTRKSQVKVSLTQIQGIHCSGRVMIICIFS